MYLDIREKVRLLNRRNRSMCSMPHAGTCLVETTGTEIVRDDDVSHRIARRTRKSSDER